MRALVFFGLIAWVILLPIVERRDTSTIEIVEGQALERSVFPFSKNLIHAVVQQESSFNHRAVSKCGAKGLMQLMPATGREWHRRLGIREPYDPFNRKQNITIGTHYLKYLVELYRGDLELALTAYNQGYGKVNNLLARNKTRSLNGIIKDLGPDGRSYARNVLSIASRVSG